MLIFKSLPTVKAALRLSSASSRLHKICTNNAELIAAAILRPRIPDYDKAVVLAKEEATPVKPEDGASEQAVLPVQSWVPRLLQNAQFAETANAVTQRFLKNLPKDNFRHKLGIHADFFASFYLLRRLVVSHQRTELRPALRKEIDDSTTSLLRTHEVLCYCMQNELDILEKKRQGMVDFDFNPMDVHIDEYHKKKWEFAMNVMDSEISCVLQGWDRETCNDMWAFG